MFSDLTSTANSNLTDFLVLLYNVSGGNTHGGVQIEEIGAELGLDRSAATEWPTGWLTATSPSGSRWVATSRSRRRAWTLPRRRSPARPSRRRRSESSVNVVGGLAGRRSRARPVHLARFRGQGSVRACTGDGTGAARTPRLVRRSRTPSRRQPDPEDRRGAAAVTLRRGVFSKAFSARNGRGPNSTRSRTARSARARSSCSRSGSVLRPTKLRATRPSSRVA